ncbi:sensor histidine kinase [Streptomyces rhizosphaerihabitans]|uniref:sensor histidine kinase n=1 Tax=Streptomyces rhizosphaerihabitans TaxID=1266770 RepID=UPI0021C06B43|nr:sensor histidine kinase [Streptomyces rhizosphaerihabitans]MCT9008378.1 sensor histidine kinase [Streptomyces rhizosphaerihabitans]
MSRAPRGTRVQVLARSPFPFLRGILAELAVPAAAPLPPLSRPRWLRRLPHVVVCVIALGLGLAAMDELSDGYRLGFPLGTVSGIALGAAIVLALWRPVPAWWLSLGATVVAAAAARSDMVAAVPGPMPGPGPDWPWSTPAIMAQAFVLFLLALRLPTRVAVGALSLTCLATYVLQGLVGGPSYPPTAMFPGPSYPPTAMFPGPSYHSTGALAVVVFAAVVLLGTALRGRREARTQLVEQASLTEEERARRTVLEERSRIARELHDVVAHHMSVISIQAQVAPHLVENPTEELKENLEGIRQNALEALTELRRVLGVLRSENPEDPYGLGAGAGVAPDAPQPTLGRLDALVENTRAAGLDVTTEITGEQLPLAPGVELSAYRIIQEALSNALRHAPGSAVKVELWHFPRGLQVRVVNSRPERPAPPSPGAGHGLLGMRERVAMLGGTLVTSKTSCGGFAVAAFLPGNGPAPTDDDAPTHDAARTDDTFTSLPDDTFTGLPGEETP